MVRLTVAQAEWSARSERRRRWLHEGADGDLVGPGKQCKNLLSNAHERLVAKEKEAVMGSQGEGKKGH